MTPDFDQLLQFFKVLGNESRLKILGLLANEERSVGELANLLDVKEPTISHHLAMMKALGLVTVRAEGNVRIYALDNKSLQLMSKDVFSQNTLATVVDDAFDASEQRVLRTYLDGDRLNDIPLKRKKRLVVLKWLVEKFDYDRHYPELELNELLKQYYPPDCASLRRYMIEEGLMARERGIYWRL